MKKLIITADDFGVFPSINQGVKDAILNNKVNSVACIPNYKDSVKNVKALLNDIGTKAEIGCHLTISSGEALTVQNHEAFCNDKIFRRFNDLNIDALEKVPELLEKELKAQVQVFLDSGIAITNLSCHHSTLTTTEGLFKVYLKVAADLKLPMRSVNISPAGKDSTYRTILNILLLQDVPLKKLAEMRKFRKKISNYLTNFETKIATPNVLESSHYGPIPQAGLLGVTATLEIIKKHNNLQKFLNDLSLNEDTSAELMTHLISEDLYLLEQDDGIDYPGIDQDYFDSRVLEYRSLNSFDLSAYPEITLGKWKDLV